MFKLPYFLEGISNIFKPVLTDEKPIDKVKGVENYRGKLSFDSDACIGCGICIRVCAGEAITKEIKPVEGGQEIKMNFDLTSCTFCGLCKDFCPKKAITLTDEVLMISENKEELNVGGSFIRKLPPKQSSKTKETIKQKEAMANKEEVKKK